MPVTAGVLTPLTVVAPVPLISLATVVGSLASLAAKTEASKVMVPSLASCRPTVLALFPPGAGDATLARLFAQCTGLRDGLRYGVPLAVEIGRGQLDAVRRHAAASGLDIAEVREDYAGIPRTVLLRRGQSL
jgi:hypothetical protein